MSPPPESGGRLDLGCGPAKPDGFTGLDRFRNPQVDVVADFDASLPFADDTFSLVYASHSLEHATDLTRTMQEIYRICRDRAEVCIVAPYVTQGIHFANPYHRQGFNEHTPRFWTARPTTVLPTEEYVHPHAPVWGLSQSDNSDPGFDFRCVGMEFFYFPQYRYLPPDEQRRARKSLLDVCDQIVYHLVVVKPPSADIRDDSLLADARRFDPPTLRRRRAEEQAGSSEGRGSLTAGPTDARAVCADEMRLEVTRQRVALDAAQNAVAMRDEEILELRAQIAQQEAQGQEALSAAQKAVATRDDAIAELRAELVARDAVLSDARATLALREREWEESRSALQVRDTERQRELGVLSAQRDAATNEMQKLRSIRESELEEARAALKVQEENLSAARQEMARHRNDARRAEVRGKLAARGLDGYRRGRTGRLLRRLFDRSDARNDVAPGVRALKDDSVTFSHGLGRYLLQPSENLQHTAFVGYPLAIPRTPLTGISLALALDVPTEEGVIGIEVVSPQNEIIVQQVVPLRGLDNTAPCKFEFPPLTVKTGGGYVLRAFARHADVPVRILEWRRYMAFGLGPIVRRVFCGYHFGQGAA